MERTIKLNRLLFFALSLIVLPSVILAQQTDTLTTKKLEEVIIKGECQTDINRLPSFDGTLVWTGKKNEVISIKYLDANIAEKTARQIFAKIPGVFVYDMDGTGNQVNIVNDGRMTNKLYNYQGKTDHFFTLRNPRVFVPLPLTHPSTLPHTLSHTIND
jgi:Fe(3+) dicitrate transport protein